MSIIHSCSTWPAPRSTARRVPLEALQRAKEAGGEKDLDTFSANIGRQLVQAGLIDEIRVHVAPIRFGAGTRLFDNASDTPVPLRLIAVESGTGVTHLRYAVIRDAAAPKG